MSSSQIILILTTTEPPPRRKEFYRMCDHFHWVKDDKGKYPPARNLAHEAFRMAMVQAFNLNFGTDVNNKSSWESICDLLGIQPLPPDVAEMKKVSQEFPLYIRANHNFTKLVRSTHVNLSDLLDGGRSGTEVQIFDTEAELAAYTIKEGRFFPKIEAYAGGVLRFLLREITGVYEGRKVDHRRKKHKGVGGSRR